MGKKDKSKSMHFDPEYDTAYRNPDGSHKNNQYTEGNVNQTGLFYEENGSEGSKEVVKNNRTPRGIIQETKGSGRKFPLTGEKGAKTLKKIVMAILNEKDFEEINVKFKTTKPLSEKGTGNKVNRIYHFGQPINMDLYKEENCDHESDSETHEEMENNLNFYLSGLEYKARVAGNSFTIFR